MSDGGALEVLDATTNALSFGGFQPVNVRHESTRHTVDCRADIDVEDGVGDFSVKVESARIASTYPRGGIHRSHLFSPLAEECHRASCAGWSWRT